MSPSAMLYYQTTDRNPARCPIYQTENCPNVFGAPSNTIKDLSIIERLPVQLQNMIKDKIQIVAEQQEDFEDMQAVLKDMDGKEPYILKPKEKMPNIGRSYDFDINFPEMKNYEEKKDEERERNLKAKKGEILEYQYDPSWVKCIIAREGPPRQW